MMTKLFKKARQGRGPAANRDGFTLVEILVVLFILSVGILPLVIIQHRARRDVTETDRYTQAVMVAQDQLERVKGMGFGNAANDTGQTGNINWICTVTNQSFGLERIELTASWQAEGEVRNLTIADVVSMR